MGSKSRIAKYIVPILQKAIDDNKSSLYIEPFCGGANIIDKIYCTNRVATDKNRYLIALLDGVSNKGLKLYSEVDKDLYSKVKKCYEYGVGTYSDFEIGNVGFLASYNGKFFDGGYAKPTTYTEGNRVIVRDYYREASSNLMLQSERLRGVKFYSCSYSSLKITGMSNVVVYCDPPYFGTTSYSSADFDFDSYAFWDKVREWSKDNHVYVSELQAPDDFEVVWEQEVLRSLKVSDKGYVVEKLFKYKG